MLMKTNRKIQMVAAAMTGGWLLAHVHAGGIPEPGIIYYGAVTNTANGNAFVTSSANTLIWTAQEVGGEALAITTPLQNINNQYSYRFRIPFESVVGGNTRSTGAFALPSSTTRYTNSMVQISAGGNLYPANIQGIGNLTTDFSASDRALVRKVNVTVTALAVASIGSGGGSPGTRTNLITAAVSAQASFQFIYVVPHPDGGYYMEWMGAPTNKTYYLLRASSVATPVDEQEVVQQFTPAGSTINAYWDTNVVNTATYFYRLIAP